MSKTNVEEKGATKPSTREELLAAVCEEVEKGTLGRNGRISMKRFLESKGWRERDIFEFFPCWNDLLQATGVDFNPWGEDIPLEQLLADWGRVARSLQRVPKFKSYEIHGSYYPSTLAKRYGGWTKLAEAFAEFAKGKEEWRDVVEMIESGKQEISKKSGNDTTGSPSRSRGRKWVTARQRKRDGVSFGAPLNLAALRNEPVSESGVVFLFGVLAERLGFSVEAVRAAFPDCLAKRRVGEREWENVRIEFEYESRNFREHGHEPEGCDMIVCWVHNWAECPENLEVIALSEEVKKLSDALSHV